MYDNYQGDPNQEVMSVGSWLITLLILAIPCVNIVMYFMGLWKWQREPQKLLPGRSYFYVDRGSSVCASLQYVRSSPFYG